MIRRAARVAAVAAVAVDLAGAWRGGRLVSLEIAALVSGAAMVPCGLSFLAVLRGARARDYRLVPLRLPIRLARGSAGVAVLGGIASLAAMGERFGRYIFLAGVVLIALALSQARPRGGDTTKALQRSVPRP